MKAKVNFLISVACIKIRTSFALMRALSQPNQTKLATVILTFWCASQRDAPKADFICKTQETHNIYMFYKRKTTISVTNFRRRPLAGGRGTFFTTDFPRRAHPCWRRIFVATKFRLRASARLRARLFHIFSHIHICILLPIVLPMILP